MIHPIITALASVEAHPSSHRLCTVAAVATAALPPTSLTHVWAAR
jgi:hypothetical protein